jgi:hypothetical protein
MKPEESLVSEYLVTLGLGPVVHEPDGTKPPDFCIDKRIAVEVRRLNQNEVTELGHRGLEVTRFRLQYRIWNLLSSLGPSRQVPAGLFTAVSSVRFPSRRQYVPPCGRSLLRSETIFARDATKLFQWRSATESRSNYAAPGIPMRSSSSMEEISTRIREDSRLRKQRRISLSVSTKRHGKLPRIAIDIPS